jgi:hypothetical protein
MARTSTILPSLTRVPSDFYERVNDKDLTLNRFIKLEQV